MNLYRVVCEHRVKLRSTSYVSTKQRQVLHMDSFRQSATVVDGTKLEPSL